jgi:hypothetical protein
MSLEASGVGLRVEVKFSGPFKFNPTEVWGGEDTSDGQARIQVKKE